MGDQRSSKQVSVCPPAKSTKSSQLLSSEEKWARRHMGATFVTSTRVNPLETGFAFKLATLPTKVSHYFVHSSASALRMRGLMTRGGTTVSLPTCPKSS